MNRDDELFTSFGPAVSDKAAKAMRRDIRRWRLHLRNDLELEDLARWTRPIMLGWIRCYGRFQPSALRCALRTLDRFLIRWAQRKYLRFRRRCMGTWEWLRREKAYQPSLFAHWSIK